MIRESSRPAKQPRAGRTRRGTNPGPRPIAMTPSRETRTQFNADPPNRFLITSFPGRVRKPGFRPDRLRIPGLLGDHRASDRPHARSPDDARPPGPALLRQVERPADPGNPA